MTPLTVPGWPEEWADRPHNSRLTDYLLGGKDNYGPDRRLAHDLERAVGWPWPTSAVMNREFGAATARYAARRGLRQFLDLGCGYPTPAISSPRCDNVHRAIAPVCIGAPVVYVDHHPAVIAHGRALLNEGQPHNVTCAWGDVTDMDALLADLHLLGPLDPRRPIAVSVHDVLPWITCDATVEKAMGAMRDWLPPGSLLSITHLTRDFAPEAVAAGACVLAEHHIPARPRDRDEVAGLFGDWPLDGPGLAHTAAWHGQEGALQPEASLAWAGVATKPQEARP